MTFFDLRLTLRCRSKCDNTIILDDQIRLLEDYIGTSIKTVLIGQKDGVGIFEFLIENMKIFESASLPQYSGLHEVKFIRAIGPRPVLCKYSS